MRKYQDLSQFKMPTNFRGRSALAVQLWWLCDALLFRNSPQFAYGFRRFLLRAFGANIGVDCIIRPTARITYPWKFTLGDYSWVGDDVKIYSLGDIRVGKNSVISQGSYICAADHDYKQTNFPIRARPVVIGDECWIGTEVFVGPGVSIGSGCVVGAKSAVFRDMPPEMLCLGSPCKPIRLRDTRNHN
jgi:putative colanic acid biosynthesis acetyltransferase WcaF